MIEMPIQFDRVGYSEAVRQQNFAAVTQHLEVFLLIHKLEIRAACLLQARPLVESIGLTEELVESVMMDHEYLFRKDLLNVDPNVIKPPNSFRYGINLPLMLFSVDPLIFTAITDNLMQLRLINVEGWLEGTATPQAIRGAFIDLQIDTIIRPSYNIVDPTIVVPPPDPEDLETIVIHGLMDLTILGIYRGILERLVLEIPGIAEDGVLSYLILEYDEILLDRNPLLPPFSTQIAAMNLATQELVLTFGEVAALARPVLPEDLHLIALQDALNQLLLGHLIEDLVVLPPPPPPPPPPPIIEDEEVL